MTPSDLGGPFGPYTSDALLRYFAATKLSDAHSEYVRSTNNLARAALEQSIDRVIRERESYVRTAFVPKCRRRRSR
jgi:hypothetical protein